MDDDVERRCEHCGRAFFVRPWDLRRRAAQFCGPACCNKVRALPATRRFWEKVNKTETCWLWTGAIHGGGYGSFKDGDAHRFSYELHFGSVPEGKYILHRCDVRSCVRPDHLFLGSHQDNMTDMVIKGRQKSKLTSQDVQTIRRALAMGVARAVLARDYGISDALISQIKLRRVWRDIGEPLPTRPRRALLSAADVRNIRELIANGVPNRNIARQFGISEPLVSHIKVGRVWRDVQ